MKKFEFFDDLELRSTEQRNEDHLKQLTRLIQEAKKNKNQLSRLNKEVKDLSDLELIPVLRKSDLIEKQSATCTHNVDLSISCINSYNFSNFLK